MSIATSIEKLSETLTNCKANLKEKEVADVDNIKISDVDEKIAEIQAGGGGFKFIENVTFDGESITESALNSDVYIDWDIGFNLTFTPKEDGLVILCNSFLNVTPNVGDTYDGHAKLEKGIEYKVIGSSNGGLSYVFIFKDPEREVFGGQGMVKSMDSVCKLIY